MSNKKHSQQTTKLDGLNPQLLLVLYLLVSALPLLLAYLQHKPFREFPNEFASAFGLIGFTWMLMSFLLSGRFRTISGKIGIDKTMRMHQLMAIVLTGLILLHPYFYTLPINKELPWDATGQLSLNLPLSAFITGMFAWILLPVFVVLALFRDQLPYRYESWRGLHGLAALVLVAASLHHVLVAGRYSEDVMMKVFWFGLIAIASLTLIRTYLILPVLQKKRLYNVVSVTPASLKTWHITIEADSQNNHPFHFKAGQFAWLKLQKDPFNLTEHPFSISSAPSDLPQIRFTIKESGDFTRDIGNIIKGQNAYLDGPHGYFIIDDQKFDGIVMLAGGIGVAPMMSIISQMTHDKDNRPVKLLYGNRIESQIAFKEELQEASSKLNLDVDYVLSDPPQDWKGSTGFLDEAVIKGSLDMPNPENWLYLLCGPPVMLDSAVEILRSAGIPKQQIIFEKFSYL